jgi:tripartite-type tricarboxylate transporter receptor subunit TctC
LKLPVLALGVPGIGRAQPAETAFPSRPLTLIVPFPAGGPTDRHLRQLAQWTAPLLGQPFIVENRPGAAGTLALGQMAATARADGYTLAQFPTGALRVPLMNKTAWHPLRDFSFVVGLSTLRQGLLVRADSRFRSAADLVRAAQSEPVQYGSVGAGSGGHLQMEQLAEVTGARFENVPFKGSSDMLQALLGGHVAAVCDVGGWEPLVEDHKLRLLMSFARQPSRRFPQVPTAQMLGWNVAGELPYGLVAPRGLDPAVQVKLHDAFRQAMAEPRHDVLMEQLNVDPWPRSSAEFRAWAETRFDQERVLLARLGLLAR